jgi:hypothetical protein
MAEVMKYEDFKEEGSENAVKVGNYFIYIVHNSCTNVKISMMRMNDSCLLNCVG